MKVDKPRFYDIGVLAYCDECPFSEVGSIHCNRPTEFNENNCPTAATYSEACALAEAAEKEGR